MVQERQNESMSGRSISRTPSRSPSPRRRRSRTRSRSRSRGRSTRTLSRNRDRSYDSYRSRNRSYDNYSDSFVSDAESDYSRRGKAKKTYVKKGGRASKVKSQARGGTGMDYVAKRMLSARRLKISEMRNEMEEMAQQLHKIEQENKMLKRLQHRQEKELLKFEDKESDLPQLLRGHGEEIKTLKAQIKKHKERATKADRRLRDTEDDLDRTKKQLKKLQSISSDKKLEERDELNRKLNRALDEVDEKDRKIQALEKNLELLKKNHKVEISNERSKHRETQEKLNEVTEQLEKLSVNLKEKEKELEIKNIYANRIVKPPHKLSSVNSTPTPPPGKPKKQKQTSPNLSPREKAKLAEEKRRDEEKRKRLSPQALNSQTTFIHEQSPTPAPPSREEERESKQKRKEKAEPRQQSRSEPSEPDSFFKTELKEDKRVSFDFEKDEREMRELEERERREREERSRRDEEEQKRKLALEREKQERWEKDEKLRRERENRDRQDREERERRERERREIEERERERQERERREREEAERREHERREREEIERRAQEERERLANDVKAQEERRKKDELLAKLKAIDDGQPAESSPEPIRKNEPVSKFSPGPRRRNEPQQFSPSSPKKNYNFTKPVENMHNGKPSHDDVTVPVLEKTRRNSKKSFFDDDDDLGIGGYQPSFGAATNDTKKPARGRFGDTDNKVGSPKGNKKANLMDDLFGGKKIQKSSFGEDDIFSSSTKAKPVSDKKAYPWENEVSTRGNRENSNNTFGSGIGFFSDNKSNTNSPLLPRRGRQETTAFKAKPAVNAVDDVEDEIEELIL